jgi:hypothetical protein
MSLKKINERSLKSGQNLNNNCSVKIIKRMGSLFNKQYYKMNYLDYIINNFQMFIFLIKNSKLFIQKKLINFYN